MEKKVQYSTVKMFIETRANQALTIARFTHSLHTTKIARIRPYTMRSAMFSSNI